jgi:hypothetical protein
VTRATSTLSLPDAQLQPFGKLAKKTLAELEAEGDALRRFQEEDATSRGIMVSR